MLRQEQPGQGEEYDDDNNELLYSNFVNALKSKITRSNYTKLLSYFLEFLGDTEGNQYSILVDPKKDKKMIEADIKAFLVYLREKRKITYTSAIQYFNAIKKFYYVNSEYDFKWPLIKMYLGNDDTDDDEYKDDNNNKDEIFLEDRPYTKSEIQTMLKTATDIRVKIIILLISSSGMRYGALPLLKLKNLIKIEKYNLYQVNVYQKSRKYNYKTFCTPECAAVIDSYLGYRKHAGETLKPESPLIREQFNSEDKFKVNNPKPISLSLIRYLVNEVLVKYSTLRQKIPYDYENKRKAIGKKNSTMLTHGLRKYFDTEARKAGVYTDIVEILMSHKLQGVRSHYFKPGINDINELLEGTKECKGYLVAIDSLTINDENRLQKQVKELKQQDDYQKYIIDKKMNESEEQIKILTSKLNEYEENAKQYEKYAKEFANIYIMIQELKKDQIRERQQQREY